MCSGNRDHRRKILINWIFEDQLKEVYGGIRLNFQFES